MIRHVFEFMLCVFQVYAVLSMFFVALSIIIFVLETHKLFQIDRLTNRAMIDVEPEDEWTPTG